MIKVIKEYLKKNRFVLNVYELIFQRPIVNYFKKQYSKKVLFSYSTYHFNKKNYVAHSNYQESLVIAKIFDEMGYMVDIYNNNREYKINFDNYDVVFGEGMPMFQAIQQNTNALTIYYATGSHPWQCSQASLNRVVDYYKKNNFLALDSTRLQDYKWGLAASLSDAVIVIGNNNTKKTFIDNGASHIYKINPTFHIKKEAKEIQKTQNSLKSMLYFASYGLLHKGLDLAVEAFRELPDWTLHVCGYTERENEFMQSLNLPKNVIVHGFIDIESSLFQKLSENCGYVILPSSSEGIATAILTAMGRGAMIPVVTKECGINIDDFGILIEDLTVKSVKKAIEHCKMISYDELMINSKKAMEKAYDAYTLLNYENTMKEHLNTILMGAKNG
ncbi:glycosyltransferase [Aliarcobacter cryaerophilus]|uniref:glycosyltransferase n=1 Tax=Aliarcobacter cryaerophilus TaxID=28198 RepID=UPI0021B4F65C|nr:glycosyltransferase [Aliarcobacter cryaerophilus]MCT7481727.1 glycosyltransferase [Aliarcobacter cryaerophilus]